MKIKYTKGFQLVRTSTDNLVSNKGFTLIEIITAMSISLVLLAAIYSLSNITGSSQSFILSNYFNTEDANTAANIIIKELRNARASEAGAHLFYNLGDNDIEFYTDSDNDDTVERVRYYLDDTDLIKQTIEPTGFPAVYDPASATEKVVAQNVRNLGEPMFEYYNDQWPADTTNNPLVLADRLGYTSFVHIKIRVNDNELYQSSDYIAESYVQVRMTKSNL